MRQNKADCRTVLDVACGTGEHARLVDGRDSRLLFDYKITDAAGTRHERDVHHLGLFTHDEMLKAFRNAGFTAEHDPVGLCDRGLYPARPAA